KPGLGDGGAGAGAGHPSRWHEAAGRPAELVKHRQTSLYARCRRFSVEGGELAFVRQQPPAHPASRRGRWRAVVMMEITVQHQLVTASAALFQRLTKRLVVDKAPAAMKVRHHQQRQRNSRVALQGTQ